MLVTSSDILPDTGADVNSQSNKRSTPAAAANGYRRSEQDNIPPAAAPAVDLVLTSPPGAAPAIEAPTEPVALAWPPGVERLPDATPQTALDAALILIAAGYPVFPVRLDAGKEKTPARKKWQVAGDGATLDPDTARAWWGPGGRYRRHGVGAALRDPGGLALDPDGAAAIAGLAGVGAAAGGLPATWAVDSGRGPKLVYAGRPAELADKNRCYEKRAELGGADLLLNNVLAWAPGRRWYGTPGNVAPCPAWLSDTVLAIEATTAKAERKPGLVPLPCDPAAALRAQSLIIRFVDGEAARIGGMAPNTGRRRKVYAVARRAGELLGHAPELEPWVIDRLIEACHACLLVETDGERSALANVYNGLADGKANPQPLPDDRPGWNPARMSTSSPTSPATSGNGQAASADDIRAAALAMLAGVPGLVASLRDDEGRPVHPAARFTLLLLTSELLRRHVDEGRSTIEAGTVSLALSIGRGADAVRRARPWIERAGWTVEPGGLDADGKPRATRYTLQVEKRQDAGATLPDAGGGVGEGGEDASHPLRVLSLSADPLCRGVRSRQLDPDTGLPKAAMGGAAAWVLDALAELAKRGETVTAGAVADFAGVCVETARRNLAAGACKGVIAVDQLDRDGPAGRPTLVYRLVDQSAATVQAVIERGRRIIERTIEGARAFRDRCRAARRAVELGIFNTFSEAFADISRRWRARAAGERAAVKKGGERGRLDLGRAAWIEGVKGMKNKAAAIAAASTPPDWMVDLWPLEVIAEGWAGYTEPEPDDRPDPLIAFALQLGGVVVGTVKA